MKPASLLLLLAIGCAVLMPEIAPAQRSDSVSRPPSSQGRASTVSGGPSDSAHHTHPGGVKSLTDKKPFDKQPDHRPVPDKTQPRGGAGVSKASRPDQLPNGREPTGHGNSANLRQADRNRVVPAAKGAPTKDETVSDTLPVRPPTVVPHTGPSHNNVQHHSPNPAVIGGSANSNARNTGAISGTGLHRKP